MTTTIRELINRVSDEQTIIAASSVYNQDNSCLSVSRDGYYVTREMLAWLPKAMQIEVYTGKHEGHIAFDGSLLDADWSAPYIHIIATTDLRSAIAKAYKRKHKYCINDMVRESVSEGCRMWLSRDGYLSERNKIRVCGAYIDYRTNDKAEAEAQAKKTLRNARKAYTNALYGKTEAQYIEMVTREIAWAKAQERERVIVSKHIIGCNVDSLIRNAIKVGSNTPSYAAHMGSTNEVICSEWLDWQGYGKSYGHPMTRRTFKLYLKRGYNVALIGGLITYYRGKYNRNGMACEWVQQGRAIADLTMVKGYIVRGMHIAAKSLAEAQRINAECRSQMAVTLLNRRAKKIADMAKLSEHEFSFNESIAAGNCTLGTQSFKKKIEAEVGHEVNTINLTDLRKYGVKFGLSQYTERVINYVAAHL